MLTPYTFLMQLDRRRYRNGYPLMARIHGILKTLTLTSTFPRMTRSFDSETTISFSMAHIAMHLSISLYRFGNEPDYYIQHFRLHSFNFPYRLVTGGQDGVSSVLQRLGVEIGGIPYFPAHIPFSYLVLSLVKATFSAWREYVTSIYCTSGCAYHHGGPGKTSCFPARSSNHSMGAVLPRNRDGNLVERSSLGASL